MRSFSPSHSEPYMSAVSHVKKYQSWRTSLQIENNTSIELIGDYEAQIWLHATPIVSYYRNAGPIVTLRTRGWRTPTTKDRLKSYANFKVFTKKSEGWHVPIGEYTPIKNRKCSCCHGRAPEFETTLGKLAGLKCGCRERFNYFYDYGRSHWNFCYYCKDTGYVQVGGNEIGTPFEEGMQWDMYRQELVRD